MTLLNIFYVLMVEISDLQILKELELKFHSLQTNDLFI